MKTKRGSFLLLGVFGLSLAACGDKTVQDYQNSEVNRRVGELTPLVGQYQGTMTAADGSTLGAVSVSLEANVIGKPSTDGLGTQQSVVLDTTVTYTGPNGLTGSVNLNGDYNTVSSIYRALDGFTMTDESGKAHTVQIEGAIRGQVFTGRIKGDGLTDYQVGFTARKGAAPVSIANLKLHGRAQQVLDGSQVFTTTGVQNPTAEVATMRLVNTGISANQVFLNFMLPSHALSILLQFGSTPAIQFPSSSTLVDDEANVLKATTTRTVNGSPYLVTLNCRRQMNGSQVTGYSCDYYSDKGDVIYNFQRVAQ